MCRKVKIVTRVGIVSNPVNVLSSATNGALIKHSHGPCVLKVGFQKFVNELVSYAISQRDRLTEKRDINIFCKYQKIFFGHCL